MSGRGEFGHPLGVPVPPGPPMEEPNECCTKCGKFTKSVFSFLFSHIGLLSLVVGYCIMGAFIFEELEKENELMVKKNVTATRHAVTEKLWDITKNMEVLRQDNWTSDVMIHLRKFEKSLIIALKEKGWDGKEDPSSVTWTFPGALFYSITVITTIGYGHIAPKTAVAKIVTIFYAIVGIPLTVLCWSNIGDAMANAFRFTYWRVFCYLCTKKPKRKQRAARQRHMSRHSRGMSVRQPPSRSRSIRRSQRTSQRSDNTIKSDSSTLSFSISDPERFYDDPAAGNEGLERARLSSRKSNHHSPGATAADLEHLDQLESQRQQDPATPQTEAPQQDSISAREKKLSTASRMMARAAGGIGFKRGSQKSQKSNVSGGSDSLPSSSTNVYNRGDSVRQPHPPHPAAYRLDRVPEDDWMRREAEAEAAAAFYYHQQEADFLSDGEDDLADDYSQRNVPIWLSLLLVIAYIVWGAFIFQEWEGWSLLDASYFCFITLTTIGFGDLVPNQQSQDGNKRLALCSLYLLIGIAMIAMSFNLVQEQVINNVKQLGRQLGILKDEDEEDEEEEDQQY